jgi:hypothetical protein
MSDAGPSSRRMRRASAAPVEADADAAVPGVPVEDAPLAAEAPSSPAPHTPPSAGDPLPSSSPAVPGVPRIEPASPDIAIGGELSGLPGAHRGGFSRELTAPVELTWVAHEQPIGPEPDPEWTPAVVTARARGALAGWALGLAVAGLAVSVFVGWGFPIGVAAVVVGTMALRRGRLENRSLVIWALVLGGLSLVYSAGWIVWGIPRIPELVS